MTIRSEQISIVSNDGFNANNRPIKNASEVEIDSPALNSNNDPKASATLNVSNDGNVGITIVDRNIPASPVTNTNTELISKDGKIKYNNISRGSDSVSSVANKFLGFNSSGNIGVFNTPATTSIAYTGITNGGSASAASNKLIGFDNAGTATTLIGPSGSADANKILKVNPTGTGWQLDTLSNTVPYTGITNGGNPTGVANKIIGFDSSGNIEIKNNVSDSSETQKGIIQIATQTEVNAGINDTKTITPLKLKNYIENINNQEVSFFLQNTDFDYNYNNTTYIYTQPSAHDFLRFFREDDVVRASTDYNEYVNIHQGYIVKLSSTTFHIATSINGPASAGYTGSLKRLFLHRRQLKNTDKTFIANIKCPFSTETSESRHPIIYLPDTSTLNVGFTLFAKITVEAMHTTSSVVLKLKPHDNDLGNTSINYSHTDNLDLSSSTNGTYNNVFYLIYAGVHLGKKTWIKIDLI